MSYLYKNKQTNAISSATMANGENGRGLKIKPIKF
jgi:hypothetical protein